MRKIFLVGKDRTKSAMIEKRLSDLGLELKCEIIQTTHEFYQMQKRPLVEKFDSIIFIFTDGELIGLSGESTSCTREMMAEFVVQCVPTSIIAATKSTAINDELIKEGADFRIDEGHRDHHNPPDLTPREIAGGLVPILKSIMEEATG